MLKIIREGSTIALTLAAITTPLAAQQVSGRVVVRNGPVAADVRVGPAYHQLIVTRYVDTYDYDDYPPGWYGPTDFQRIVVYVDRDGRYYDRWDSHLVGLRTVVVYRRAGHYYWDDGRFRGNDRRDGRFYWDNGRHRGWDKSQHRGDDHRNVRPDRSDRRDRGDDHRGRQDHDRGRRD